MYMEPNITRLSQLDIANFKKGQDILFCPQCNWQQMEPYGMKPECPECRTDLHFTIMCGELRDLETING